MRLRILTLVALFVVATATTCSASAGIALAPSPSTPADSVTHIGLRVAASVAAQHGLTPSDPRSPDDPEWLQCFAKESLWLCGRLHGGELQFLLSEAGTRNFTAGADSVRLALLDGLRSHFGPDAARKCNWKFQKEEHVCVSPADS